MSFQLKMAVLALLTMNNVSAQEFYIKGTELSINLDAQSVASTTSWNPCVGTIPVDAGSAIKSASDFHNSMKFDESVKLLSWNVHRVILVPAENDHWYWIVTFRGTFSLKSDGAVQNTKLGGYSYSGPKTLYNHYPVLFDGKVPSPRIAVNPAKQLRSTEELLDGLETGKSKVNPREYRNLLEEWPNIHTSW